MSLSDIKAQLEKLLGMIICREATFYDFLSLLEKALATFEVDGR